MRYPLGMDDDQRYLVAVGQQLRAEIAASGRSAAAIARMTGMDKTVLHRYLHAQRDLPLSTLRRICDAISIDPALVLERAEERMGSSPGGAGNTR